MIRVYSDLGPQEIGKQFYQQLLQEHERQTSVCRPESINNVKESSHGTSVACYETYWDETFPFRVGTGFHY